jgi:phage shock protein A
MLQRITTQLKRVVGAAHQVPQELAALRQALSDLESDAAEFRRARDEHAQTAVEWESKQTRATAAKQDDLAEIALVRKGQFQESAERISSELLGLEMTIGEYRQTIAALETPKGD